MAKVLTPHFELCMYLHKDSVDGIQTPKLVTVTKISLLT